jgi:hypothetical protein
MEERMRVKFCWRSDFVVNLEELVRTEQTDKPLENLDNGNKNAQTCSPEGT